MFNYFCLKHLVCVIWMCDNAFSGMCGIIAGCSSRCEAVAKIQDGNHGVRVISPVSGAHRVLF